ncbi:hypothetical protein F0562_012188 [Nyssa sinensis]|uniref:P-type ATPase A domain-containing protein n=1 Tax=Nyssa sinensis TaxID=561372 RepID=A0A5J4ZVQ2_9ASTE|nr:hypothetical protein F0562_012188 [Nyssa sinensis]
MLQAYNTSFIIEARLEANVKLHGEVKFQKKWPDAWVMVCGLLLALSFLKYVYYPLRWLAVGAVAIGLPQNILRSIAAIRNFTLNINVLVLIAVGGTLALQDFWEAGSIVFLFGISQWLESRASYKAMAVMSSLVNIAPQKAIIAETGEQVDVNKVQLNTILAVRAGDAIPIDGIVVEGQCEVDEKMLTGEPFPVAKQLESIVWAGTINLNGYVSVKTTALAEDCVVARMAKLVEDAHNNKSRAERLIDSCAKYYIPAVMLISAGVAVVPVVLRVHNQTHWFYLALVVLRFLLKLRLVAFDKTGTITRGEFMVTDFQSLTDDISLNTLLYWVSSIESKSSHPMAAALIDYGCLHAIEPKPENVEDFQNFPGEGIFGKIDGKEIYIGNRRIAVRAGSGAALTREVNIMGGKTTGFIYFGSTHIGIFSLSDACRSGAMEAIEELKSLGIKTIMLTGDCHAAAMLVQDQLRDAFDEVRAELLPVEKARIIEDLKERGPVAMIGDGINDAPALATADIGISMGISGSALAMETGHVILMSNNIQKIPEAVRLAKRTHRKLVENVVLSITTKGAILVLAFAGYPLVWAAVLADVGTCLIVILNSMLLLRETPKHERRCFKPSTPLFHENTSDSHTPLISSCSNIAAKERCKFQDYSVRCQAGPISSSSCGKDRCRDSVDLRSGNEGDDGLHQISHCGHKCYNKDTQYMASASVQNNLSTCLETDSYKTIFMEECCSKSGKFKPCSDGSLSEIVIE